MITQLEVKNWKSFGEATLYVDPLTVLIGTNSSGKSNLLEAFVFLSLMAKGVRFEDLFNSRNAHKILRGTASTLLHQNSTEDWFGLTVHFQYGDDNRHYRYTLECELNEAHEISLKHESLEEQRNVGDPAEYYYLFKLGKRYNGVIDVEHASEGELKTTTFLDFASNQSALTWLVGSSDLDREVLNGVYYTIYLLSNLSLIDPLPRNMRAYSSLSSEVLPDCSNIAGVLAKLATTEADRVQSTLTNYIDLLSEKDITRVWAQAVAPLNKDAMLYIEESWPGRPATTIDAESASDGTLHLLGVMVAILTAKPKSLIIIEEVDKGLHPSRADLLVRFLKEMALQRKIDILCTTHNPALLDAFGNEMISNMSITYRDDETGQSSVKPVADIKNFGRLLSRGRVGRLSTMGLLEKAAG